MNVEVVEHEQHTVGMSLDAWQAYSLAWTAYLRILPKLLLKIVLLLALPMLLMRNVQPLAPYADWWNYAGPILVLGCVVYDFASLRAVRLYTDRDGVWLSSGILPWNRGVSGVKWRDVSEAGCYLGFWSWLTRSYTVRVVHRFTKGAEVIVRSVWRGQYAAGHINDVLMNPDAFFEHQR